MEFFAATKSGVEELRKLFETLDKDLDIREKWLGIRQLKAEYRPTPYSRKTKEGEHIRMEERAEKATAQRAVVARRAHVAVSERVRDYNRSSFADVHNASAISGL